MANSTGAPSAVLADIYAAKFDELARLAHDNPAGTQGNIQVFGGVLILEAYSRGLLGATPGLWARIQWLSGKGKGVPNYARDILNLLLLVAGDLEAAGLLSIYDPFCVHQSGKHYALRPDSVGSACRVLAAILRDEMRALSQKRPPGRRTSDVVAERRNAVKELLEKFTQGEVADRLGLSIETVKSDRKFLANRGNNSPAKSPKRMPR